MDLIPVNEPVLSDDSKRFVNKALDSGWISSSGNFVKEFEINFASYIGMKHGITVSSGTAALHVALLSLGIRSGDEVIIPAFTMAATWLAVLYTGAKPVFVDCELDTYNIDVDKISAKITSKTRAIIPVHIYGHSVDMNKLKKITKGNKKNIYILEDAAEACGAEYNGKKCGSFGIINCFSFYANKLISTGEGGMIVTNDDNLAERARRFKDLCHSSKKRFIHDDIGYNYRLTNLQAALGCGELMHIHEYLLKKDYMASMYKLLLSDIPGIKLPTTKPNVKNIYWMYSLLIDEKLFGISKNKLREELLTEGIETRDFFYSPTDQPILKKYVNEKSQFPNTKLICESGLYIPSGLGITDRQIRRVAESVKKIYIKHQV